MSHNEDVPGALKRKRRSWTMDEKRRIVDESVADGALIAEVARRHDLNTNQLFTWRRQFGVELAAPQEFASIFSSWCGSLPPRCRGGAAREPRRHWLLSDIGQKSLADGTATQYLRPSDGGVGRVDVRIRRARLVCHDAVQRGGPAAVVVPGRGCVQIHG